MLNPDPVEVRILNMQYRRFFVIILTVLAVFSIWDGLANGVFEPPENMTSYRKIYLHESRLNTGVTAIILCFIYWVSSGRGEIGRPRILIIVIICYIISRWIISHFILAHY